MEKEGAKKKVLRHGTQAQTWTVRLRGRLGGKGNWGTMQRWSVLRQRTGRREGSRKNEASTKTTFVSPWRANANVCKKKSPKKRGKSKT